MERCSAEYEVYSKHAKMIAKELGVQDDSKGSEAPIERSKAEDENEDDEDELMDAAESARLRALAA